MRIPNSHLVEVPEAKLVDYLLSDRHVVGRHKAVMFRSLGFTIDNWELLAQLLKQHVLENDVTKVEPSPFGQRFVVEGIIEAADGRTTWLRAVWFLRDSESIPRFVTAYPTSSASPKDQK
jgi:hypothetical protein